MIKPYHHICETITPRGNATDVRDNGIRRHAETKGKRECFCFLSHKFALFFSRASSVQDKRRPRSSSEAYTLESIRENLLEHMDTESIACHHHQLPPRDTFGST
jgi:hypothetical protein